MTNNPLPREVAALVNAELQPGERITWAGQPIAGRLGLRGIPIALFGIPWTAFAIFWVAGASHVTQNAPGPFVLFPLFGVPFILIGIAMLSSPFWLGRIAERTAYVITSRRVLIIKGGFRGSSTVRSYEPARLNDIRRVQKSDGTGDLIFERTWRSDGDGGRRGADHGFIAIRDVQSVENLIRDLAAAPPLRNS